MTPQRSGFEPAPLLKILTGLLFAKLSIPSSLAKYFSTVLPTPTRTGGIDCQECNCIELADAGVWSKDEGRWLIDQMILVHH